MQLPLHRKRVQNYASFRVYIIMTQNMKLMISPINNIRAKVVILDPAMVVVAHICKQIAKNPVCKRCKLNLGNHVPAGCPSRKPPPNCNG